MCIFSVDADTSVCDWEFRYRLPGLCHCCSKEAGPRLRNASGDSRRSEGAEELSER